MPVIQIQKRKSTNQLGDLLKTLYEGVLLLSENDEIKLGNSTSNKRWKEFEKTKKVQLIYNHKEKEGKFTSCKKEKKKHLVINTAYLGEDISDTIIFTSVKNRVFSTLFSHIRNAFAHNQIFVDGEDITMYDRLSQQSAELTMIAHVKVDVLKEMIRTIKDIK